MPSCTGLYVSESRRTGVYESLTNQSLSVAHCRNMGFKRLRLGDKDRFCCGNILLSKYKANIVNAAMVRRPQPERREDVLIPSRSVTFAAVMHGTTYDRLRAFSEAARFTVSFAPSANSAENLNHPSD